jgi:hypothetical protein
MQLLLNIYDENNRVIDHQYKAEEVNILFGTIEDLIDLIDENNLQDNMELAKVIVKSMKKLKPILKQVFIGVTDEELRFTRTNELVPLFIQIVKYMFTQVNGLGDGSKN